ncbi:MAG: hypothetical protein ABL951_06855 [Alphaproteobacteria bacterium]
MKNPDNSSRNITSKNDREARQAEALRANLRRRKAFAIKNPSAPETDKEPEPEKPVG